MVIREAVALEERGGGGSSRGGLGGRFEWRGGGDSGGEETMGARGGDEGESEHAAVYAVELEETVDGVLPLNAKHFLDWMVETLEHDPIYLEKRRNFKEIGYIIC